MKTYTNTKRPAVSVIGATIVVLLIIIASASIWYFVVPSGTSVGPVTKQGTTTVTTTITSGTNGAPPGNIPSKITFTVLDQLAGTAANAPTLAIYPAAGTVIGTTTFNGLVPSESPTVSSAGIATSAIQYPPGALLNIKLSLTNYVTQWASYLNPGIPSNSNSGVTSQSILYMTTLGTFSISLVDDKGNSYATGNIANFTAAESGPDCDTVTTGFCLGENTINFQVTVRNTVANTGYATSISPLTGSSMGDVLLFSTKGSYVSPAATSSILRGSNTTYPIAIPDGISNGKADGTGISVETINGQNAGGSYVINFAIGKGTLATNKGQYQIFSISQELYASLPYFFANGGAWNSEATTTGAAIVFTLKIGA